jgi:hypothetical protein
MTIDEAAEILLVSPAHVQLLLERGELRHSTWRERRRCRHRCHVPSTPTERDLMKRAGAILPPKMKAMSRSVANIDAASKRVPLQRRLPLGWGVVSHHRRTYAGEYLRHDAELSLVCTGERTLR